MSGSEPRKVSTGIAGLDEMLGGGFPKGHVILATGLPGTGKTCLGLQFLCAGLPKGEKALFLSLEEDASALLESARGFGWPADEAITSGALRVLRLDPKETKQNLQRIQGSIAKDLAQLAPSRIVVDSVSLLNMLSDDEPGRRQTLFGLAAACRSSGATTLLTAEADPTHPSVTRDGLSEYVADGVILLGYSSADEGRKVGLAMRVLKMRRTSHARTSQPYTIGPRGIEVDAKAIDFGRSL